MTTVAETTTTVQFDTALRTLAARATERYAGEAARVGRGLLLALNGHVTLHADGTASVTSGTDAEIVYTVNGHCDCPDAQRAPEGRCKHRWAKCLVKRARAEAQHAELETIDRLSGLCDQVLDDIAAARRLLESSAPRPDGRYFATDTAPKSAALLNAQTQKAAEAYYATYRTVDNACYQGTATYADGSGWVFRSDEDDFTLAYADEASLVLGGRVDLVEAQRAADGDLVAKVCGYGKGR